jgi:hypothetical protein
MDRFVKTIWPIAWALLSAAAWAQTPTMRDPTLPPPAFVNPADGAFSDMASDAAELRLEAIRRGTDGVAVAVINGALYRMGAEVAGRRIVRIAEDAVWLRGAQGREVLRMTAEVGKVKAGR